MATIAIQRIGKNASLANVVFATADATLTDKVPAVPGVHVLWKNVSGGALVVTQVSVLCSHNRLQNEAPSIPATTGQATFNPSDTAIWKQPDGNINYTHGGSASLSVAAIIFE